MNGRRGEFTRGAAGRRGASVVRYEKMVIPSRMCPMHMHIFPQNGWSEGRGGVGGGKRERGGGEAGERLKERRGRTKRVAVDIEEGGGSRGEKRVDGGGRTAGGKRKRKRR